MKVVRVTKITSRPISFDITTTSSNFFIRQGNSNVLIHNSPSVVFGHHPATGQFFVSTKSAFNKEPKINYTHEDIENNHGHAPGLVSNLKKALDHLPKITPKSGVFQGDLMHHAGSIDKAGNKLNFKPNTITYTAHQHSDEGKKLATSSLGVAVHTGYDGKDITSMKANYTPDLSKFKQHSDVHAIDVGVDMSKVHYPTTKQADFKEHMAQADKVARTIKPAEYKKVEPHTEHLKTYINRTVREGTTPNAHDFYSHVKEAHEKEIKKVKMPKTIEAKTSAMNTQLGHVRANSDSIDKVLQVHHHLQGAKNVHNEALSPAQRFETSIKGTPTKGEGFVAVVNNRPTKIVDREEFSRQNFLR